MAPITRKSAMSSAAKPPVHRKSSQGRSFAESTRVNGFSGSRDTTQVVQNGHAKHTSLTTSENVMDQINPLRDMADRVGREVDHFAETLDDFSNRLHGQQGFDAAYDLTVGYKDFAHGMVKTLKERHDAERVYEMKNDLGKRISPSTAQPASASSFSGALVYHGGGDPDVPAQTSLATLRQWQAEEDTWELFRIMLQLRYDPSSKQTQQDKNARLDQLGPLNSYTTDSQLWERFTLGDNIANERHLVLKWLQGAANHGESDIEAISEELETKSGRGSGLWYNGWMETREKIKGAKRMRVFPPGPSDSIDIKRSSTNEPLVSSLDPDAPTRQRRALEKADEYSERALWMTCWEMLRRGRSWTEISQWCAERNQSWRAVSVGAATDSDLDIGLPGASAGSLWRRMCYALVQNGTTDEYEAAVYGILSGDLDSVKRICRSWDDHVFAHYNSLLISQFEEYLQTNFPQKLASGLTSKFPLFDSVRRHGSPAHVARTLIQQLGEQSSTSKESRKPLKLIQGSLIADTFSDLCNNLAVAISDAAWYQTRSTVIAPLRTAVSPDSQIESVITNDYDALRIVTHMVMMLREFYDPFSDSNFDSLALDNIIAAYIQLLRAAGKWDLIPLYASRMAPSRSTKSLAQAVSDVQDIQEKMRFVKLISVYSMDPVAVLVEQAKYLMEEILPNKSIDEVRLRVLEKTNEEIYPGLRIKLDFAQEGRGGQGIADHLAVFYLIEGNWDITFETLAYACRKLLLNGCYKEASRLVDRLSYESLSAAKSRSILGKSLNVMDREEIMVIPKEGDQRTKLRTLQKQSRGYYELSLLIKAVDALDEWRKTEHDYATKVPRPSSVPAKVKAAFEHTCSCVEPILSGILLNAKDDDEAADLAHIRNWYLPELVLAYNAVLCAAAHMISRDSLLRSMELANDIANDKNGLAECFKQAGRMRELVTALARSSELMLKLTEVGKGRGNKKNKTGRNHAIWEIGV